MEWEAGPRPAGTQVGKQAQDCGNLLGQEAEQGLPQGRGGPGKAMCELGKYSAN